MPAAMIAFREIRVRWSVIGGRWRQACGRGKLRCGAEQWSWPPARPCHSARRAAGARRTRRRRRRGAIPICRVSGRAPTWSACRSSGRAVRHPAVSHGRRIQQRQKDAEKQADLDNESFSVDNVKPEVVAHGRRRRPDVAAAVLARARRAVAPVVAGRRSAGRPPAADDARRPAPRRDDQEHLSAVHRIQRGLRTRAVRSLHFARRARLDVPGRLQQRQPVHPVPRLRRPAQRDDSRDAGHPARRPAALSPKIRSPTWAIRADTWRATRWSCARRTSTAQTGATANGNLMIMSDALEADGEIHAHGHRHDAVPSDGQRSEDVDEAVDRVIPAQARPELQDLRIRLPRRQPRDVEHPVGVKS